MSTSEVDKLEKYLAEKAKQDQEKALEVEPLSAYEACVLRESDRVRELVAEAKKGLDSAQLGKICF